MDELPEQKGPVRYPQIRHDLLYSLALLADSDHQERTWTTAFSTDLEFVENVLFHVLNLPEGSPTLIGNVLLNGEEMQTLVDLTELYDDLMVDLGDTDVKTYLIDSRWPEVVRLSGRALATIVRNNS